MNVVPRRFIGRGLEAPGTEGGPSVFGSGPFWQRNHHAERREERRGQRESPARQEHAWLTKLSGRKPG